MGKFSNNSINLDTEFTVFLNLGELVNHLVSYDLVSEGHSFIYSLSSLLHTEWNKTK